jgi:glycosyltransferase involved in cell wall biosynthesis
LGRTASAKAKTNVTNARLFPSHAARDVGGDVVSAGVGIANRVANNKPGARPYSLFFASKFRHSGATLPTAAFLTALGIVGFMKILQMFAHSYPCGASRHMMMLAEGLRQRGHQVTLVCRPGGWLPAQARASNIPVLELEMHGLRCCMTLMTLVRVIKDQQIDIIHAHASRAAYQAFLLGFWTRCAVVASIHALAYCHGYRQILPHGRNRVIAVSSFLRDALLGQGIPPNYVRTVYNGTDILEQRQTDLDKLGASVTPASEKVRVRTELQVPAEAQLIGLVGHLGELKGQWLLVEAARAIITKCPLAYFVFVGPTKAGFQQLLIEMAVADDVAEHLRITGFRDDVAHLISAMDLIVVPSRIETFSLVAIEAMGLAKPVIATRVGGLPEVVNDGETGLLVEREAAALAEAIIFLLQNPEQRAVMGEAGQERVRSYFSIARMVNGAEEVYEELLRVDTRAGMGHES